MLFEHQTAALCAVHALNNILQGEVPPFSEADLREGARLAQLADVAAEIADPASLAPEGRSRPSTDPSGLRVAHELPGGNFSSEAVGRALGRRRFDWRAVTLVHTPSGSWDPEGTVAEAFGPVVSSFQQYPVLGFLFTKGLTIPP